MSETPSNIVVDVRAVEKHFGEGNNRIHVLKKVNLQAYAGEIMMLVGPSGCGKTTLLSAIAGTLRVEAGEVNVFGKPLHSMPSGALTRFRASNIGFIFQQFNLIPTLNIAENVSVPLMIQGSSNRKALDKARAALESVGLGTRWREHPNKLSGGQQQRVAIARALVHEPPTRHLRRTHCRPRCPERRNRARTFPQCRTHPQPRRDHRHPRQPHLFLRRPHRPNGRW